MAERRRQEIEEKKAKLAELRRARDERKALLAQAETAGPSAVQQVSCSEYCTHEWRLPSHSCRT